MSSWCSAPTGSPNPDPISDQKMSFSTPVFKPGLQNPYPFSDLEVVTKRNITCLHKTRNYVIIAQIKTATKRFLKMRFEFAYYTSFLIYMELKRQAR